MPFGIVSLLFEIIIKQVWQAASQKVNFRNTKSICKSTFFHYESVWRIFCVKHAWKFVPYCAVCKSLDW